MVVLGQVGLYIMCVCVCVCVYVCVCVCVFNLETSLKESLLKKVLIKEGWSLSLSRGVFSVAG